MLTSLGSHQRDRQRAVVNGNNESLLVGWPFLKELSTCLSWDLNQWFSKLPVSLQSSQRNLSLYQLMTTVTFHEINFNNIRISWRDKNLWTCLLQHGSPCHYNQHKTRPIFIISLLPILPDFFFPVCVGIYGFWCFEGRIFPAVTPLNGLEPPVTPDCMLFSLLSLSSENPSSSPKQLWPCK